MADSRFNAALKRLNSFQHIDLSEEIAPPVSGTWSTVHFYTVKNLKLIIERREPHLTTEQDLKVAVSICKDAKACYKGEMKDYLAEVAEENGENFEEEKTEIKSPDPSTYARYKNLVYEKKIDMFRSMRRLREKGVSTHFNLPYLAYASDSQKISPMGLGDLYDFMIENYKNNLLHFNLEFIRRIVGQMVLGLANLHDLNLAHRDIKLENFLLFYYDNKYFVKLGDHGEVMDIFYDQQRSTNIPCTPDHQAPELAECINQFNVVKYNALDKKAIDCYALGYSIDQIFWKVMIVQKRQSEDPEIPAIFRKTLTENVLANRLHKLTQAFMHDDPTIRMSIAAAKENVFFGETPAIRAQFFAELIAEANNYCFYVNKIPQSSTYDINEKDYQMLLDLRTQTLFARAQQINEQLAGIQQPYHSSPKAAAAKMTEKLQQLEITSPTAKSRSLMDKLAKLEFELNELIVCLQAINNDTKQADDYISLKEAATIERDKVTVAQEKLRIETLKQTVMDIINQLSPTTKLNFSFFNANPEVTQLKQFQTQFIADINKGASYATLLDSISQFLGEQIPANSIKDKFNQNLTQQLGITLASLKSKLNVPDYVPSQMRVA